MSRLMKRTLHPLPQRALATLHECLQLLTLVPGVKWNLTDTWVLGANVTIPLTSGGLTAPFTPFVGLDYALGR